jgi:DNA polymerase-3 subunit delta'
VFRIDPADSMNDEAQNALLKTLEEPASRTVLVLVASRGNLLLPTVRSRCLGIRFGEAPRLSIEGWLRSRGVPEEEIGPRAALASGRPGRALEMDLETAQVRREGLLRDLEDLAASPDGLAHLADRTGRLAGSSDAEFLEGLEIVQGLLRDAARCASGMPAAELEHSDLADRVHALGGRLGAARAAALVTSVDRCRSYTRFHVNRSLITEAILAAVTGGPLP